MPRIAELKLRPYPKGIVEFDNRFTAPLSGFRDVTDYYTQSSAIQLLDNIVLPTLIITAKDDPVIPFGMFVQTTLSPSTQLVTTEHGGHVAHIAKSKGVDPDRWWMDWRVVDWINAIT